MTPPQEHGRQGLAVERALADYDSERVRELRPRGWLAAIAGNLARNRARRNEPAFVKSVMERLAQVRGVDPDQLAQAVFNNTLKLYNITMD